MKVVTLEAALPQSSAMALGFPALERVSSMPTIAHLFGSAKKRCGIYLLALDAASFNDCLDLTAELRRDKGDWQGEVSRNRLKAEHLVPGTDPRRPTRYDDAMLVLREHMASTPQYRVNR